MMSNREKGQDRQVMVEALNIHVSLNGCLVLEEVNLQVLERSFTGLIGPNGGGKTTLLRTILGLIQPDKGEIKIQGKRLGTGDSRFWAMGYVPQQIGVNRDFPISVLDTVVMGRFGKIGLGKRPKKQDRELAMACLEKVGMAHVSGQQIGNLSGGEKQRVFIARALCAEPMILILDEPMAAVDVAAQDSFYRLLRQLQEELSLTVIMATHDVGVIPIYCDSVACLNRKLHLHGKPEKILKSEVFKKLYGTEVEAVMHGKIPHRMMKGHHD
jgi:zinc transport system ATP-binding protein